MVYTPKVASPAANPVANPAKVPSIQPAKPASTPQPSPTASGPVRLSPQAIAAAQVRRQASDPNDPGVQAQAKALHDLIGKLTVQEAITGSPATALVGAENAANLRLGSSRRLVTDGGFWKGMKYSSLDAGVKDLQFALNKLRAGGNLPTVMQAYEGLYGTTLSAVLGERVRNPEVRRTLMAILPPPISQEQLTKDAFIEQLAVQYVYLNVTADALNKSTNDGRRGSSPRDILRTFGYRAGPPIAGKWGFQMRVFLPLDPKSGKPPIVAFRGTEGISFDVKGKAEGTLDTIIGDFAPAGVGYNQYLQNHALIRRNMLAAAQHGKLIVTGHSLGGALAQIAATEFREHTTEVVTFQAAAISQQDVNKMKAHNAANPSKAVSARHYRVDGDVVPNAGQANLPGEIHYFDRMVKAKGTAAPYKPELKADTVDLTRAQGGHVAPILSTYLRGQGPQNAQQTTLAHQGIKDESTLGQAAQDVQMIYGGKYSTERDPRIELEPRRTTTMVKAMNMANLYEDVYYDQIAYNTLLDRVEDMAGNGKYSTFQSFAAAAGDLIDQVLGGKKLPLGEQDKRLGKQLKLPNTEKDYDHPMPSSFMLPVYPLKQSRFVDMQQSGVQITVAAAQTVATQLMNIWNSWHPEEKK